MASSTRQLTAPRIVGLVAVIAVIVLSLFIWPSGSGPAIACRASSSTTLPTSLSPSGNGGSLTSGGTVATLPPSHDNDAGRSRIPDGTPDADNDATRALGACPPG